MADWQPVFNGTIWQLQQMKLDDGRVFENAVRTPGVRALITDGNRILLNREVRNEHNHEVDLRLPGGKVFDDLGDYLEIRQDGEALIQAVRRAVVNETNGECGLIPAEDDMRLIARDVNGGKGEWDLYYFLVTVFSVNPDGPELHDSEVDEIIGWEWFSKERALELALDTVAGMKESRSARYVAMWALGHIK